MTLYGGREHDPTPPTEVLLQRVSVPFQYPVVFTRNSFHPFNRALVDAVIRIEPQRRHRLAVVVDAGVDAAHPPLLEAITAYADAWADHLELVAEPLVVTGGETITTTPGLQDDLLEWFCRLRLDRQSVLVVIGGGAVLDAVGYAAAVFHRGLRLVRFPTTVLAQDDSGVGVKNGINAFGVKNGIGTFFPPFAVINDVSFLRTLHRRDQIAGMAEAVKVALIRDHRFFQWLEGRTEALAAFDAEPVEFMIKRSAELHVNHIASAGDPFECGSARPLDFGHWAAHKLESMTSNALRHGEAVAIGMAIDTHYSAEAGLLESEDVARVRRVLSGLGFTLHHDALDEREGDGERTVLRGLDEFREHLGGDLSVTMLAALGQGVEVHEIDRGAMERAICAVSDMGAARCG